MFVLCLRMRSATDFGSVVVGSGRRYIGLSLLSISFVIGKIRRPCDMWCWVNSKDPVGTMSRLGLNGWVV